MFEAFAQRTITVESPTGPQLINFRIGGNGSPLLLLHGYPQTHVMWHAVAPQLIGNHTVVCADLRGYGDSGVAESNRGSGYTKRVMAGDMIALMTDLGFERFAVCGHDRGGRVAYRMALDHADIITKLAVLDINPTSEYFKVTSRDFVKKIYHWYFLSQPTDLPEKLIGPSATYYLTETMQRWAAPRFEFAPEAMAEYLRCGTQPDRIHAACEDYRAGATADNAHDLLDEVSGIKIACPVLLLYGQLGIPTGSGDPAAVWRKWADNVTAKGLRAGHFIAEEAPEETIAALEGFL